MPYIAVVPLIVLDLQVTTQQQFYCKSILPYLTEQPIRDWDNTEGEGGGLQWSNGTRCCPERSRENKMLLWTASSHKNPLLRRLRRCLQLIQHELPLPGLEIHAVGHPIIRCLTTFVPCLDVGWQAKDVGVEVTGAHHALGTVAFPIASDVWTQGHKRTRASVSRSMSKGVSVKDGFLGRDSVALEGRLGRFLWWADWLRRMDGVGCCRKREPGVNDSCWGPRGPMRREMVDADQFGQSGSSGD